MGSYMAEVFGSVVGKSGNRYQLSKGKIIEELQEGDLKDVQGVSKVVSKVVEEKPKKGRKKKDQNPQEGNGDSGNES